MLVEFFGPSGVGKSTTINHIDIQSLNLFNYGKIKNSVEESRNDVKKKMMEYEKKEGNNFTNTALNIISTNEMNNIQKFGVVSMINSSLYEYFKYKTYFSDRRVIFDEFLLNRANSFLHYSRDYRNDAIRYFSTVPVPDIAICLAASPEIIISRFKARNEQRNSYFNLSSSELREKIIHLNEINKIGIDLLANRGVRVFRLETDNYNNVEAGKKIFDFLSKTTEI